MGVLGSWCRDDKGMGQTECRTRVSFGIFRVVPEGAWHGDFGIGGYGVGYCLAKTGAFDLGHFGIYGLGERC